MGCVESYISSARDKKQARLLDLAAKTSEDSFSKS